MSKTLAETHPELFHYTNAQGLAGIIESQSIWATHYAYLNDAEEISFFLKDHLPNLLRIVTDKYIDELLKQDSNKQFDIDQHGNRKELIDSFIQKTQSAIEKTLLEDALAEPYIASFCTASELEKGVRDRVTEHGLLSQWRGYGREGGYAIVFDTARLLKLLEDKWKNSNSAVDVFSADVVYSSDSDSKFLEEFEEGLTVIKTFFSNHLKGEEKNIEKIYLSLMHCACRYKHWGFKEENEVRVVALPHPLHHEEFREDMKAKGIIIHEISRKHFFRAGALVPYIDLFDGITSKPDNKILPIKRIIVGPTTSVLEKNKRINAVKMLINQNDIEAEVTASEIPYIG